MHQEFSGSGELLRELSFFNFFFLKIQHKISHVEM